jgi:hypothetical protein
MHKTAGRLIGWSGALLAIGFLVLCVAYLLDYVGAWVLLLGIPAYAASQMLVGLGAKLQKREPPTA